MILRDVVCDFKMVLLLYFIVNVTINQQKAQKKCAILYIFIVYVALFTI